MIRASRIRVVARPLMAQRARASGVAVVAGFLVAVSSVTDAGVGHLVAQESDTTFTYRRFEVLEVNRRIMGVRPIREETLPGWARDVSQVRADWSGGPDPEQPYFEGPIPFVVPPIDKTEPFYSHNHGPSITWLDNGDLFVTWFSTERENDPESTFLASRLRRGQAAWDPASEFFKEPSRSMAAQGIWHNGEGTLLHQSSLPSRAGPWRGAGILMRRSTDNGVTWTAAQPISTGNQYANGHFCMIRTQLGVGSLVLVCESAGQGSSFVHLSDDGGYTWYPTGGLIRGMHAGVVELSDGKLLAFGRHAGVSSSRSRYRLNAGDDWPLMCVSRDGAGNCVSADPLGELRMPMSRSPARQTTRQPVAIGMQWEFKASPFPPIGPGQRLVLMRLREGPLMLVSFTSEASGNGSREGMSFLDRNGGDFVGYGMFAALSWDDGETWPTKRLITPGNGEYDGGAWTGKFVASSTVAEHAGYLSATQTPDGVIHLVSSRLHYRFNLAWLLAHSEASRGGI